MTSIEGEKGENMTTAGRRMEGSDVDVLAGKPLAVRVVNDHVVIGYDEVICQSMPGTPLSMRGLVSEMGCRRWWGC